MVSLGALSWEHLSSPWHSCLTHVYADTAVLLQTDTDLVCLVGNCPHKQITSETAMAPLGEGVMHLKEIALLKLMITEQALSQGGEQG